jgi:outer membrane protein assembly factor BamD (BamD/ComL family)
VAIDALPVVANPARPGAGGPGVKSEREAPSLERELSLLERARTRLSEGQPQSTLQLLREHRLSYPNSALQQEREALTIRALTAAGRISEARDRAARFVEAYPTSPLRGSVERAVESIP